jgi:hypothetical protein
MIATMIRINPKIKRVFLQRYLVSKFCYRLEESTLGDLCCLFENQLWLEKKCLLDHQFATKFGKSLEDLSVIMKQINFQERLTNRAVRRFSLRLKENLGQFALPERNYKDAKRLCSGQFSLIGTKSPGISKRKLPPKTYIGKGYRDKGTVKDMAKDGSPSWQEVAMHRGPLYYKGRLQDEEPENTDRAKPISEAIAKINLSQYKA